MAMQKKHESFTENTIEVISKENPQNTFILIYDVLHKWSSSICKPKDRFNS